VNIRRLLLALGAASAALYGYALYCVRRFEDIDLNDATLPGSHVVIGATRVHFVEAGNGPALILIHGLAGSTFSFRYLIPELAQHFRVIALDLRGFGFSERARGDHSLAGQTLLVAEVMSALGVERAHVLGHSMGAGVAQRLAIQHRERVDRLILVDSATAAAAHRFRGGPLLPLLMPVIALFTVQSRRSIRRALHSAVHDPSYVTSEVEDGYTRPFRVKGNTRSMAAIVAHRQTDQPVDTRAIAQPTLVLWGEHDRWLSSEGGRELAESIPGARFATIRSAGHLPLEEQPELSMRQIMSFLEETLSAPAEASTAGTP
jgi:pimeloyl-ACP methyl ester carboxylesterase